jgi:hypothetical protein
MLIVMKNNKWHSSWPLKTVDLKHVKDFYRKLGYATVMIKEVMHLSEITDEK